MLELIEEMLYCTTGCGSNADPADGFGYCTCGQEDLRKRFAQVAKAKYIGGSDDS